METTSSPTTSLSRRRRIIGGLGLSLALVAAVGVQSASVMSASASTQAGPLEPLPPIRLCIPDCPPTPGVALPPHVTIPPQVPHVSIPPQVTLPPHVTIPPIDPCRIRNCNPPKVTVPQDPCLTHVCTPPTVSIPPKVPCRLRSCEPPATIPTPTVPTGQPGNPIPPAHVDPPIVALPNFTG